MRTADLQGTGVAVCVRSVYMYAGDGVRQSGAQSVCVQHDHTGRPVDPRHSIRRCLVHEADL